MKKEIFDAANIYKTICMASSIGKKWGISVGELKKEYKMKNRDINALLSFLQNYTMKNNDYIQFEVYKLSHEFIKNKEIYNYTYEELIDYLEEVDLTHDVLDNDVFIRIQDKVLILGEKINEDSIDVRNASLIQSIYEVSESWNKISDFQMDEDYVLIKENIDLALKDKKNNKRNWINGIVKGYEISIVYKTPDVGIKQEKLLPMGMYYNKFLNRYICVYLESPYEAKNYKEIFLDEILSVRVHTDGIPYNFEFNIEEYITSNQIDKIVLYVFHEGNVSEKLKSLLADNQLDIKYGKDYDIFTFMTENYWQYIKVIKSYGRSVVVAEPEVVRKDIIDNINDALNIYENNINIHISK